MSMITSRRLNHCLSASSFGNIKSKVRKLLKNTVLVGHGLRYDLKVNWSVTVAQVTVTLLTSLVLSCCLDASVHHTQALRLSHPIFLTEDVQVIPGWHIKYPAVSNPRLKFLVRKELGIDIPDSQQDSVSADSLDHTAWS